MKIPEIKRLIDTCSISELQLAEENLLNEEVLNIVVNGVDEGEQLTHLIAAIWCKKEMSLDMNLSSNDAIRKYTLKVRNTIN